MSTNGFTPITLVGNAVADPELRFGKSGAPAVKLTVAVNKRVRDANGGWVDGDTSYYRVVAFRGLAENVAESIQRGMRVIVSGEIRQVNWTTDAGEKRSAFEVVADVIGPDLTFATAKVVKATRGQSSAPIQGPPEPWQQ